MSETKCRKIGFRVPTKCYCGAMLPDALRADVLERVQDSMADWFNGYDCMRINGGWKPSPTSPVYKESVDYVVSLDLHGKWDSVEHDFELFARDLARELTQGAIGCDIDGDFREYKAVPAFDKCLHGKSATATVNQPALKDLLKLEKIERILKNFAASSNARDLFCGILNYAFAGGNYSTANWASNVRKLLKDIPEILVDHNGFKVIYVRLAAERLRRGDERVLIQRVLHDNPSFYGLFLVSNACQDKWEFVNVRLSGTEGRKLLLRRIHVGVAEVRTATERISSLEITDAEEATITPQAIQERHNQSFDVEAVTREFYRDVADWYFWAMQHDKMIYPRDVKGEDKKSVFLIRLLTRLVFCWFLREMGLIPSEVFCLQSIKEWLKDSHPESGTYYRAILQNLFFATLNQEQGKDKRTFQKLSDKRRVAQNSRGTYLYRDLFAAPDTLLQVLHYVPFVNGGLFDCLDELYADHESALGVRLDDFSESKNNRLCVPNELFFAEHLDVDLSKAYGDTSHRKAKVRGLVTILDRYKFTVEESTPLDQEVALDPEMLGKVFENLLASYNEDTRTTARKAIGAFYTPREIVSYMVDESLIVYLTTAMARLKGGATSDFELRVRSLFEDTGGEFHNPFTKGETDAIISAIDSVKILDPACGSGAFPMGALHRLVDLLQKLDPNNRRWKEQQLAKAQHDLHLASQIEAIEIREAAVTEARALIRDIEHSFDTTRHALDFARKLFLIENAIYCVDIQPIACQIAKLRFFIALIVDQHADKNLPNHGVKALPNLETKIVAANTLVPIAKPDRQLDLLDQQVRPLRQQLTQVRHEYFATRQVGRKIACRRRDAQLREEIADLLRKTGMPAKSARNLALWDPYDQNAHAEFFDSGWMFGIPTEKDPITAQSSASLCRSVVSRGTGRSVNDENGVSTYRGSGFDIVIGNPPYFKENDDKRRFDGLRDLPCYQGKMDVWYLFVDIGLDILKPGGVLSFIATNNWGTNAGASKMRNKILKEAVVARLVDFQDVMIFESASIQTMIMLLCKGQNPARYTAKVSKAGPGFSRGDVYKLSSEVTEEDASLQSYGVEIDREALIDTPLLFNPANKSAILDIIQKRGDFYIAKNEIAQGIVPNPDRVNARNIKTIGKDRAGDRGVRVGDGVFVLDASEDSVIKGKDRRFLKPLYEPIHIEKYRRNPSELRILYTKKGLIDPAQGMSIISHLSRFREIMEERRENRNGQIAFYNLHWPRDEAFFCAGEKILAPRKCASPVFYFTNDPAYVMLSINVIKTARLNMRYLSAILNSTTIRYWLRYRGNMQGMNFQVDAGPIQQIPIPQESAAVQELLSSLVSFVQLAHTLENCPTAVTQFFEDVIDACVMECYFREYMTERNLLFLDRLSQHVAACSRVALGSDQSDLVLRLHDTLIEPSSGLRDRLRRISTDSPDLLALIKRDCSG